MVINGGRREIESGWKHGYVILPVTDRQAEYKKLVFQ